MATRNDITGQQIKSRGNSTAYTNNWDAIFGKKNEPEVVEEEISVEADEDSTRQE